MRQLLGYLFQQIAGVDVRFLEFALEIGVFADCELAVVIAEAVAVAVTVDDRPFRPQGDVDFLIDAA